MKTNLRKSLDSLLGIQKLLDIKFKVFVQMLSENEDLSDEVLVLYAELANHTSEEKKLVYETIENTIAEMRIFGEEGLEKRLGFTIGEPEEDEPENDGYGWMNEPKEEDYEQE